ncbi:MAG: ribosome biogenesis GTPase Der [Actinobacteria bacterium]|nr:MAG: ribosome biogenesis GTPase Der [Actinomycetota bacterium]
MGDRVEDPANGLLHRETGSARHASDGAVHSVVRDVPDPTRRIRSRGDPRDARRRSPRGRARDVPGGNASGARARAGALRRCDDRRPGESPCHLRSDPRDAGLALRQLPPGFRRVRRALHRPRPSAQLAGLPRRRGGDPRRAPPTLDVPRAHARARPAARREAPAVNEALLGTVAIIGFPNVGKSTLVNRLTESRAAVVHETPGVTRDRKELVAEWAGGRFLLVDTGGVDVADRSPITQSVGNQAREAVAGADLVLFIVDARAGITPGDEEVADILRRARKPVLLVANKIDDPSQESVALEFHRLGLGDPFPISALHGYGTGDLLDEVLARLPGEGPAQIGEGAIRVAILGRPNVGKSSLLNAIIGRERVIVSDVPGTTRDAIDTVFRRGDRTFVFVDTAGLRRKRKHRQGIEYYSQLRALEAAERADIALVLIDTSEGIVDQDLAVADVARKAQCSTIVVLSKWDASTVTIEDVRPELERRLRQRPPWVAVSAKTGRGIERLLDAIERQFDKHTARVPTPELNRFVAELREARQPPSRNGRRLNLLYAAQVTARPPRFRVSVNDPSLVTRDYGYWFENRLRDRFDLEGVPVSIDFVRRS